MPEPKINKGRNKGWDKLKVIKSYKNGEKKMKETLKHREIFEFYYSIGDKRSITEVARKFTVSRASVSKWSRVFNWQKRIEQRDIEIGKELEKKTLAILF